MNLKFKMDKIVRSYLEDGMTWSDKKTTPFVVIEGISSNEIDFVKVTYSVFSKDKSGNVSQIMKNITATILHCNLLPCMRDSKLEQLLK